MLRFLLWRLLGVAAAIASFELAGWLLAGGPGDALRGHAPPLPLGHVLAATLAAARNGASSLWLLAPRFPTRAGSWLALALAPAAAVTVLRGCARRRRRYARLRIEPYRGDRATSEALIAMYESLHKRLLRRWWRRLLLGQPSAALELHHAGAHSAGSWLAVCCPHEYADAVQAALRSAYPNCRVRACGQLAGAAPVVLRLKKRQEFLKRVKQLDRFEQQREPPVNRLITAMAACGEPAFVQVALTPTPASFEQLARALYKRREKHLSGARLERAPRRSLMDDAELRGGLDVQHRPLFFAELRVVGATRRACEQIASELRAGEAENRLVERGTGLRHGVLGLYARRVQRGEGNPIPSFRKGVYASTELAAVWQLPSTDYASVPLERSSLPLSPAPPAIFRPGEGRGTLRDAFGPVSIHVEMRKQNTAVPGTVEQGKSSFLVASVGEDLCRERCAVIVLDPKGDAADAALSLVAPERTCTLLDFSNPTCGFNPLAVDAPADVIADYVVAALKNLFTDGEIRASSDRYLRNAIIAVLAYDRRSTLWDAARLLSVGEEGYSYRRSVGARVRALPEFREIASFFTEELSAQLADARSPTTAKLDAPLNKLARLLNSSSIKRVLLNGSLTVDFETIISRGEVLIVKGALGAMGAGNTAVLMQLLVGMLDASLARQQDLRSAEQRVAVALKIDEAPLVINAGFAETLALKRSAGLETVACWQSDAQWTERDVRDQLDALFAHRVYFATASSRDARAAVALTMAEFSDSVRPGTEHLSALGRPDVRLHLPKHHAIVSWSTPEGRQAPFIAETLALSIDHERIALHAARQRERGGRPRTDLRQPHWEDAQGKPADAPPGAPVSPEPQQRRADERPPVAPERREDAPLPAVGTPRALDPKPLPDVSADSYRELVELDRAGSVRRVRAGAAATTVDPDALDVEILVLLARFGHVLTSQIHRRFNPSRAATTTQRRLKRLSDAGLLERLQFHRHDGGGVPMCCLITAAGKQALEQRELLPASVEAATPPTAGGPEQGRSPGHDSRSLRQARHEAHVVGWVLALAARVAPRGAALRGPGESALSPPYRSTPDGRVALALGDLRLPGGRTPHDFLRTDGSGTRAEVARFETIRPDAIVEVGRVDIFVELDDRLPEGRAAAKLERYEHFLAGWSEHTRRYGSRRDAEPFVVFVCRDRARARALAQGADALLRACRAYAGEYPFEWSYTARERIAFAAERDMHEGVSSAYSIAPLPPDVRVAAHNDPAAGAAEPELRELPLDEQP